MNVRDAKSSRNRSLISLLSTTVTLKHVPVSLLIIFTLCSGFIDVSNCDAPTPATPMTMSRSTTTLSTPTLTTRLEISVDNSTDVGNYSGNVTVINSVQQTLVSTDDLYVKHPGANNTVDNGLFGMDLLPMEGTFDLRNGGALVRAFYVIMGLTLVVVVYFGLRAFRIRRRRNKSHKYGVLSTNGDLELTPFDVQEEDDETTVFEVSTNHT